MPGQTAPGLEALTVPVEHLDSVQEWGLGGRANNSSIIFGFKIPDFVP